MIKQTTQAGLRQLLTLLIVVITSALFSTANAQYTGVFEADAISQLRILQAPGSSTKTEIADFYGKVWVEGDDNYPFYSFTVTLIVNGEIVRQVTQIVPNSEPATPNFLIHWAEVLPENPQSVIFQGGGSPGSGGYSFYHAWYP